ncbi:MAG: NADH-quinone oxidoreductase subunit J [Actinomycetia bacterium]|nr:NADH-quinone oxidoreductase subunit J [Actinomycetes bacterium]MCP4962163.1 NADH-quinone oxidoreductase subunit J [Actinomycetes bacterium]
MIDLIVFLVAAAICLVGAVGVVVARNPVHSALMLVMTLFGIAVHFVAQEAHFLAAVQVIVYAGAIVVMFLFVIMLLGVDVHTKLDLGGLKGQRVAAAAFGVVGLGVLVFLMTRVEDGITSQPAGTPIDPNTPDINQLAHSLFDQYVFAFELTSVLLIIAVIGAVILSRKPRPELEESQGGES